MDLRYRSPIFDYSFCVRALAEAFPIIWGREAGFSRKSHSALRCASIFYPSKIAAQYKMQRQMFFWGVWSHLALRFSNFVPKNSNFSVTATFSAAIFAAPNVAQIDERHSALRIYDLSTFSRVLGRISAILRSYRPSYRWRVIFQQKILLLMQNRPVMTRTEKLENFSYFY